MAKGKKQTAEDLLKRYSDETISLRLATSPVPEPKKKPNALLERLRQNVNRVAMIPLDLLVIEENVRRQVDEKSPEFTSLVDSIRETGIRQNIIVDLQDEDDDNFRLVVVAGQRRTLAGRKAGVQQVAALVVRMSSRGERLVEGLAENLLREDLHCLDQAEAYAALIEEGWSQEEIAHKFERRRRTILQFLRLARYPQRAKDLIRANRELFTTNLLFNKFIAKNWKSEEELIQAIKEAIGSREAAGVAGSRPRLQPSTGTTPAVGINTNLNRLIALINRYNGLGCKAKGTDDSGKITITYKSKSALEKIIALFEED